MVVSNISNNLGAKKKKRRRISLTCILVSLGVTYVLFLYSIMVAFDGGKKLEDTNKHNNDKSATSSSQLRPPPAVTDTVKKDGVVKSPPLEEKKKKQATIADFCGSCMFRDQDFNCDERVVWVMKIKRLSKSEAMMQNLKYCLKDGSQYDVGEADSPAKNTKSKQDITEEWGVELDPILSGSFIKDVSRGEIDITQTKISEEKYEGLMDFRKAEDIVGSVLSAAKYGDREYDTTSNSDVKSEGGGRTAEMPVLTAYCEPVNQTTWKTKPLPSRQGPTTKASLIPVEYPTVKSCKNIQAQWPIDTPPVDIDPFLPWIHDVFPSADGKSVVFIAQNRRRCFNGQRRLKSGEKVPKGVAEHNNFIHIDYKKNYFMRPQSALFQHVPVKKIHVDNTESADDDEPRYRLASHEEADPDGMETRMICRFKQFDSNTGKLSVVGYSLSVFEVDYDYHTRRKGYLRSATAAGFDNHMIWQSQLLFKCPIPEDFNEQVKSGDTVVDDYSTLFVDLIPIRTPPRYTSPKEFLQPRYNFNGDTEQLFVADNEFGKEHVLPKIEESGRWENIVSIVDCATYPC